MAGLEVLGGAWRGHGDNSQEGLTRGGRVRSHCSGFESRWWANIAVFELLQAAL